MSYHRFGKVNFSTIISTEAKLAWFYSYQELQKELNDVCNNHILKKVYVGLEGYLESMHQSENYYDFSYFGGPVILIFDDIAVELYIHGMGMVQYCKTNLCDIKIKEIKNFPPSDMGSKDDNYFYDLSKKFELSLEYQKVKNVIVTKTNCYPFSLEGFDEQKAKAAEETNSLPSDIHFHLANGVDFGIYAANNEYYYIELKK